MLKIIYSRSLFAFCAVLSICSFFSAVCRNLTIASAKNEGISFSYQTPNQRAWNLSGLIMFHHLMSLTWDVMVAISVIFLFAVVALIAENQSDNFAKLSIIGASRLRIVATFLWSLTVPFSMATVIGAVVGVFADKYFVGVLYHIGGYDDPGLIPKLHISSVIYPCLFFAIFLPVSVLLNLNKFLKNNLLAVVSGQYRDLSKISILRAACGICTLVLLIWGFESQPYNGNFEHDDIRVYILDGLEVMSCYLLVPIILKLIMSVFFRFIGMFFPITALLARRNFHANIRRYVAVAAPIIVCLALAVTYFASVVSTADAQTRVYLGKNLPISAVGTGVDASNLAELAHYQDVKSLNPHAQAMPVRQEIRWTEQKTRAVPFIFEVKPDALQKILPVKVTSGNLAQVHGVNIASTRDGDKVGKVIHMLTPAGRKLDLHIVAILETAYAPFFEAFLANYASFPDANTSFNNPHQDNLFTLAHYDILYTGVTMQQLHDAGLSAISYSSFVHNRVARMFDQRGFQFEILFMPILALCLSLVIINSLSFSAKSEYIRRVFTILGGSRWQAVYILFAEFIVIFFISILITPLENIVYHVPSAHLLDEEYQIHLAFDYPVEQIAVISIVLLFSALIPPIIKMYALKKKYSMT